MLRELPSRLSPTEYRRWPRPCDQMLLLPPESEYVVMYTYVVGTLAADTSAPASATLSRPSSARALPTRDARSTDVATVSVPVASAIALSNDAIATLNTSATGSGLPSVISSPFTVLSGMPLQKS